MRLDSQKSRAERARLGAYYTPDALCDVVVSHTVAIPLWQEWAKAKQGIHGDRLAFADRLNGVRVLDPACGDGAMLRACDRALETLDLMVRQAVGGEPRAPMQGMLGLDIDAAAVGAARAHGIDATQCDALATTWPACDFIVGNPPFLGGSKFRRALGNDRALQVWGYSPSINRSCDLAMHFWARAGGLLCDGHVAGTGFVMPNGYTMRFNQSAVAPFSGRIGIKFAAKNILWPGDADVCVCIVVCQAGAVDGWLIDAS